MKYNYIFWILVVAVILITGSVWMAIGHVITGLLHFVPPLVLMLASRHKEVPIFQLLSMEVMPSDPYRMDPIDYAFERGKSFFKLTLLALAAFGILLPFARSGYIGQDYQYPTNPLTIFMMILPILLSISIVGFLYNLVTYIVLVFRRN